jgi:hypothetical protein
MNFAASPVRARLFAYYSKCCAWVMREEHREKARQLKAEAKRAFTEHPEETGETYLEHLWFTTKMALRFLYSLVVLMIHGLFPFLLERTASRQIEAIYRIMKTRIPKSRRDAIDSDYTV